MMLTCDLLDVALRGLPGAAALTGFTTRAAAALVHLRDAWLIADDDNRPGIVDAMAAVLATRSCGEHRKLMVEVLTRGIGWDTAQQLLDDLAGIGGPVDDTFTESELAPIVSRGCSTPGCPNEPHRFGDKCSKCVP